MKCLEFKILYSSCEMVSEAEKTSSMCVTYLSCSIDNLSCIVLAIVLDNPAESVLNCRVIAFHKVVLNKTNSEGGFACVRRMSAPIAMTAWVMNEELVPTERLPTIAIFRCLGAAGILRVKCGKTQLNHH